MFRSHPPKANKNLPKLSKRCVPGRERPKSAISPNGFKYLPSSIFGSLLETIWKPIFQFGSPSSKTEALEALWRPRGSLAEAIWKAYRGQMEIPRKPFRGHLEPHFPHGLQTPSILEWRNGTFAAGNTPRDHHSPMVPRVFSLPFLPCLFYDTKFSGIFAKMQVWESQKWSN